MVAHIVLVGFLFYLIGVPMSYTQAEIDSIKEARLALAKGEKVVSVTMRGKRIEYRQSDVTELTKLLRDMEASRFASTAGRTYVVKTSKGL
jgi:hypothetical protein